MHFDFRCLVASALFVVVSIGSVLGASRSPVVPGAKAIEVSTNGAGEGPAWHPEGYLLSSGEGHINKHEPAGGVTVFRRGAGSNGLLVDRARRLVICESTRRRVTRLETNGQLTVLADQFNGKKFNTPNDLTIDSRGRIYFSDPRYGPRDDMEQRDERGQLVEGVYRIDGPGQVTRVIAREVERPNGVLVSAGDEYLYVADNNNNTVGGARKLWRFNLQADGTIRPRSRKLIFDWKDARGPDGFKMDQKGRFYVAAGLNKPNPPYETADRLRGGLYILSASGQLLDTVPIPNDEVTNCAFGGGDLKTVFVTAGGHLWSIQVDTPGRVPYREP
jgi:gluconolactonase